MDSSMENSKKRHTGRRKIQMAKIQNPNHRQVTFSKRRLGLFKKASELCTLCGIQAIILIYSPGQKMFSFGQPNVESVVDRYLGYSIATTGSEGGAHQENTTERALISQLTKILDLYKVEKERAEVLENMKKANPNQYWWGAPIKELGLPQLESLKAALEILGNNVNRQAYLMENKP